MCFQGIRPLKANQEVRITFKLEGMDEPITVMAKIVWLSESRKGGALQFVDLPETSRQKIRNWISQQKQVNSSKEASTPPVSRVKGKELRAPSVPSAPAKPAPVAPADTIVVKPTPSPLLSAPSAEANQSVSAKISSGTDPGTRKSLQSKYSQALAELQRASQIPAPSPKGKELPPSSVISAVPADAIATTPQPSSSLSTPAVEASQPVAAKTVLETQPEVKETVPLEHSEISAELQQPSQIPDPSQRGTELQPLPIIASTPTQNASPVPATAMFATPPPSFSLATPTVQASQSVEAENASRTEPEDKDSLPLKSSETPADLHRFFQVPVPPPVVVEKKHGRSIIFALGLAASVAIAIAGGGILWPYRAILHPSSGSNSKVPAAAAIETASAPKPAPPQEQAQAVEPSKDLPANEPLQSAAVPVPEAQENPPVPPAPNVPVSTPTRPAVRPTPAAPKMNRVTTPAPPSLSASNIQPSRPPVAPTHIEQAAPPPPPPHPTAEAVNEPPVASAVATSAKIAPPEVKPAANSVSATGSIEIIPDPYPSIRMPAASQVRSPQPTTSLQIGRLVTKIEPVYPPDALRQRSAAKVKVHIFIGRNGTVEGAQLVDGPVQFADAALRAIDQWRFEPTMLGGTAIEVEEDVTLVFRIVSPSSSVN
jgi:TonB family protein